jgi:predicted nucleotide-binding protein
VGALQDQLNAKANVTIWNQGVFALNASYVDSLIDGLKNSDFGVFVFFPDDILTIREETLASVRDNVLFEFGLFTGRLGKETSVLRHATGTSKLRLPTICSGSRRWIGCLKATGELSRVAVVIVWRIRVVRRLHTLAF